MHWAKVQNMQNQLFAMGGHVLFAFGLWLVRKRFLNTSWRMMLIVPVILINLVDIPITFITVFDVVRNQYLFLDDGLITAIPNAISFIVTTYVIVEMAEPGSEALTYGALSMISNLGSNAVSTAISNGVFAAFRPAISNPANYIADTPDFRWTVAWSYFVTYACSFGSLAFLPLLPSQKDEAQHRRKTRPHSKWYAWITVGLVSIGLCYSILVDVLSMVPDTSCLPIAGGTGCNFTAHGPRKGGAHRQPLHAFHPAEHPAPHAAGMPSLITHTAHATNASIVVPQVAAALGMAYPH